MKELLQQYAKYNVWANKRIIDVILKLDAELFDKEMVSSFPSIKATVYHTWSAESVWMQRLALVEQPVWLADVFAGTFEEACANWQKVSEELVLFVEKQYDERSFQHVLQYYNFQKQSVKLPVYTVLMHIFNHSTQHRGQLVTMLRQAGARKIPATDLVAFAMGKG